MSGRFTSSSVIPRGETREKIYGRKKDDETASGARIVQLIYNVPREEARQEAALASTRSSRDIFTFARWFAAACVARVSSETARNWKNLIGPALENEVSKMKRGFA